MRRECDARLTVTWDHVPLSRAKQVNTIGPGRHHDAANQVLHGMALQVRLDGWQHKYESAGRRVSLPQVYIRIVASFASAAI